MTARTYNQNHVPRPYDRERRRVSIYVSWSYPGEAARDVGQLDNRFSTMTEVRRVLWPMYEEPEFADPLRFQQGIAGSLELFFRAWIPFQDLVGEATGHTVPVFQRVDQAGYFLPLDERVLDDCDTLLVFGLDHNVTDQAASAAEIEALRAFLARSGTRVIIGPHHDVGASGDREIQKMEYAHHGDPLVPRQQRFGRYTRMLLDGLGIPIDTRYGCRPAVDPETRKVAPLNIDRDLDTRGWLEGVTSLNFHMHLPHYAVTGGDSDAVRILGRQPIDLSRPHPLIEQGEKEFNSLVWVPPSGERAGDVLITDSTNFSTLFGADESLERFWRNVTARN